MDMHPQWANVAAAWYGFDGTAGERFARPAAWPPLCQSSVSAELSR
jgi:hypothetical protein